jgi:hypothetical protein
VSRFPPLINADEVFGTHKGKEKAKLMKILVKFDSNRHTQVEAAPYPPYTSESHICFNVGLDGIPGHNEAIRTPTAKASPCRGRHLGEPPYTLHPRCFDTAR